MSTTRAPLVVPVLAVAITAISAAAVLVRLVPELPAPAVAMWRCTLVALVLAPTIRRVQPRDLLLSVAAGLALALHFWTWFESLRLTSVLRSTVLVCLSPVWTALLESIFLRHRPTGRHVLGVVVALVGVGVMARGGPPQSQASLAGDLLAGAGGVLAGVYMVTGRAARQRVGIGAYGALVSGSAALWLLPAALLLPAAAGHAPHAWGYSPRQWTVLVALAAGPQLLGHVGLNYAVRYLPAAVVSLVVLLEPGGAAVLAGLALGEWAGAVEWIGAAVILAGVAVATVRLPTPRRRRGAA